MFGCWSNVWVQTFRAKELRSHSQLFGTESLTSIWHDLRRAVSSLEQEGGDCVVKNSWSSGDGALTRTKWKHMWNIPGTCCNNVRRKLDQSLYNLVTGLSKPLAGPSCTLSWPYTLCYRLYWTVPGLAKSIWIKVCERIRVVWRP